MGRNYGERTLVWVSPNTRYATIKYGFRSGLRAGLRGAFGQTVVAANSDLTGLVIGANSPKPARASIITAGVGIESSFCSHDKIATLKADGYSVTRGKTRSKTRSSLVKTMVITINGIKYAWLSPITGVDLTGVGVTEASDADLVIFGAEFPKPARASTPVESGKLSIFIDPSKEDSLPAGWTRAQPGFYDADALATYL